jgi:hypothetical protein
MAVHMPDSFSSVEYWEEAASAHANVEGHCISLPAAEQLYGEVMKLAQIGMTLVRVTSTNISCRHQHE